MSRFLTAKLFMDKLGRMSTPKGVQDALSAPPKALNEVYNDIINRIIDTSNKELGLKALTWVAYASRPLSATELRYALSAPREDNQMQHHELPDIYIVLSV